MVLVWWDAACLPGPRLRGDDSEEGTAPGDVRVWRSGDLGSLDVLQTSVRIDSETDRHLLNLPASHAAEFCTALTFWVAAFAGSVGARTVTFG